MFDGIRAFLDRTVGQYVPIQGHIRPDMLLLNDGGVFAMVEVTGQPWETSEEIEVAERCARLCRSYQQVQADTLMLTIYQCRGMAPSSVYPRGTYRSAFAAQLDAAYEANLFRHSLYLNRTFIGIQIRPDRYVGEFIGELAEMNQKPVTSLDDNSHRIQLLTDNVALLMGELRAYKPRRIGQRHVGRRVFSEIAETLVFAMTGVWRPIGLTTGRMGDAMFSEQIIIDRETIKFLLPGAVHYGAAFGMKHFPPWCWPGMFGQLLAAPFRCTVMQSFQFINPIRGQDIMRTKRSRMLTAEDPAVSQAAALLNAADGLQNAEYALGDYGFTLLAFADTPEMLTEVATAAWGCLADSGMVVAREMLGLEAAFFSMLPGNSRLRPRPGYITSRNFAAMAPLHAFPTGEPTGYWGEPAAVFRNAAGLPFFYHFHVNDVGNTFVCGMVGSGKTTELAMLMAQAERFGATVVVWDVDRGLKIMCRALGGSYLELRNPTGLAPLKRLTDGADDIGFLTQLIRSCILADGGPGLTPEEDRRLALALHTVMSLPADDRWLEDVCAHLGVAPNGAGARLQKWCHGHELGWVFDNPADLISTDAKVIGFDQTFILTGQHTRGPVMAILYHYVEQLIDGRRLLFVVDEFESSMQDRSFAVLVAEKLRRLRKRNSPVILSTQSPNGPLRNETMRTVLRDQCPSAFYFANPRAAWDDYGAPGMGLTEAEFAIVKALPPGRGEFLLKQGPHSVRVQMPLDGMDDETAVMSGRDTTNKMFERVDKPGALIEDVLAAFHEIRRREGMQ